jgi:hypothetical protein
LKIKLAVVSQGVGEAVDALFFFAGDGLILWFLIVREK